jgi:hypothetical protein
MRSRVLFTTVALMVVGGRAWGQTPPLPVADPPVPSRVPAAGLEQGPPLAVAPPACGCVAPVGEDDGCGKAGRFWVEGEYLRWFLKGSPLPPLVTTSPAGTAAPAAGVVGLATTAPVIADTDINGDSRSGGRFTFGFWFDHDGTLGIEANFLVVEGEATGFAANSNGSLILARPFFDTNTNVNRLAADLIALPSVLAGSIAVRDSSTGLIGTEVNFREQVCHGTCYRVDVLGGYRYLRNVERLSIVENLTALDTTNRFGAAAGSNIVVADGFVARNEFHGGNFGLAGDFWWNQWTLGLLAKAAVGYTHLVSDINGGTQVTAPGAVPVTSTGGFLAGQFNIGHHDRWVVPVIPEFGVNLGYQVTSGVRLFVGYTFLFWGDVFRAGDQIDFSVNSSALPLAAGAVTGDHRPASINRTRDLWVQGIDLGAEWKY